MKITKKLRDLTPKDLANHCIGKGCRDCILNVVKCCMVSDNSWIYHKELYSDKFLDQTIEVEVDDILTKEEKEYLKAVIKPFRNEIKSIQKIISCWFTNKGWVQIKTPNMLTQIPFSNINTNYVGMERNKPYTLEELGL